MDQLPFTTSPETMSGAPVFRGTRVPVQCLVDCLKAGDSIDDFLEGFPTVRRDQVVAVLDRVVREPSGAA